MNKLGVYLHLPFCRARCAYCDFYSTTDRTVFDMRRYVYALERHIEYMTENMEDSEADTVYFGGGTPSVIGVTALDSLLSTVNLRFGLSKDAEITLEANPAEICDNFMEKSANPEKTLLLLRNSGFNRISFGVQSSNDDELSILGRRHTFADAQKAVKDARNAGFDNLSLDLMYALPNQTMDSWKRSVNDIINLNPEHISCYALRIEDNTPICLRRREQPDDEVQLEQYLYMCETLKNAGYEQYEVSNFAKPGKRSRHNSKYWVHDDYLGFGAGAHSFMSGVRFAYGRDMDKYTEKVMSGKLDPDELNELEYKDFLEEFIMLSLRTCDGLDETIMRLRLQCDLFPAYDFIEKCVKNGLCKWDGSVLKLTPTGFFVSNAIIVELLCLLDKE